MALGKRISPETHTKIAIAATQLGTTINGYIKQVLEGEYNISEVAQSLDYATSDIKQPI